jgi:carboxypeptidase C (cathepsin A)
MKLIFIFFATFLAASYAQADSFIEAKVTTLPGYGTMNGVHIVGYLPTYFQSTLNNEAGLFFWYVQQESPKANAPIILWFNGGPGAASTYGFFMENGPFSINQKGKLLPRADSWNKVGDYMIIDQPAGVGYSYGEGSYQSEEEAMDQLTFAVSAFFEQHPEFANKPLYLAGESYAGKYIPQLAVRLLRQKKPFIPKLEGLFIGDPWVNPRLQQKANMDYAYYHGLIDQSARKKVVELYDQCVKEIDKQKPSSRLANQTCVKIQEFIQKESGNLNLANVQKGVEPSDRPMVTYLNNPKVRQSLRINPLVKSYNTFNASAARTLEIGEQDSLAGLYPQILAAGVKVLIFNGIEDGKDSNFLSSDLWLGDLSWPGKAAFANAATCVWRDAHEVHGYIKNAFGLTQVKIRGAGHLAPIDQPTRVLSLLQIFISNKLPC